MICMRKICLLPLILVVMKWNVTNCIAFCLMTIVAVHLFHLRAPAAHLSMPQLFTHCLPTRPSSVLCWLILCMYYCKTIVWYTFSLLYVSLLFRYCLCKCFFLYHVCPACSVLILLFLSSFSIFSLCCSGFNFYTSLVLCSLHVSYVTTIIYVSNTDET